MYSMSLIIGRWASGIEYMISAGFGGDVLVC